MDSLRGLAALLIFFVHYYALMGHWVATGGVSATLAATLESIAHSGTDLFFTLSGYLIYNSLMTRDRPVGRYIVRRFSRIYPTFLFVVGGYLLIFAFDPTVSKIPADTFHAVLYILANLALLPGIVEMEPIVAPAWSLSYLGVFYIAAPVMVHVLKLRQWRRSQRIALLVALATVFLVTGAMGGPVRLAMFLGGMLLYELHPRVSPAHAARLGAALFIATAVILATITAAGIPPVVRYIALLLLLPAACGACISAPAERGPLSWNWLHYLGRITLSYIMVHGLMLHLFLYAVEHSLPGAWQSPALFWLLMLPAFLVSAAGAAIIYTLVEGAGEQTERSALAES